LRRARDVLVRTGLEVEDGDLAERGSSSSSAAWTSSIVVRRHAGFVTLNTGA